MITFLQRSGQSSENISMMLDGIITPYIITHQKTAVFEDAFQNGVYRLGRHEAKRAELARALASAELREAANREAETLPSSGGQGKSFVLSSMAPGTRTRAVELRSRGDGRGQRFLVRCQQDASARFKIVRTDPANRACAPETLQKMRM